MKIKFFLYFLLIVLLNFRLFSQETAHDSQREHMKLL